MNLTEEHTALLREFLLAPKGLVEVVVENGDEGLPRYRTARELERGGLLQWLSASGSLGRTQKRLRIAYALTPEGRCVAQSRLS
jgi:hypothetical protein